MKTKVILTFAPIAVAGLVEQICYATVIRKTAPDINNDDDDEYGADRAEYNANNRTFSESSFRNFFFGFCGFFFGFCGVFFGFCEQEERIIIIIKCRDLKSVGGLRKTNLS